MQKWRSRSGAGNMSVRTAGPETAIPRDAGRLPEAGMPFRLAPTFCEGVRGLPRMVRRSVQGGPEKPVWIFFAKMGKKKRFPVEFMRTS